LSTFGCSTQDLQGCRPLNDFYKNINVESGKVVLVGFAILAIVTLLGVFSDIIVLFIGFLYPAYCSFKALETKDTQDDDKQWLTYWVVFMCISLSDDIFGIFLDIIPLHHFVKLLVYIWLFYPRSHGALTLYSYIFKPLLDKYVPRIEATFAQIAKEHPELGAVAAKLE
jgi:receptor expression-enhancing protein 5/6